jgi:hypothetical protein
MHKTDLIKKLADIICQNAPQTMHKNFFFDLANELRLRGFELQAHQEGIRGTHIILVQTPLEDRK